MKHLAKSMYLILLALSILVIGVSVVADPWFIVRLGLAFVFLTAFLWAMERKDR